MSASRRCCGGTPSTPRWRAPPRTATASLGKALAKIVGLTSGDYIREVINTVLGKRAELARMVAYHESREDWAEAEALALKRLFGVDEHTEDALIEQLARVLTDEEIDTAISALPSGCDAAGKRPEG